jgi:hypothetical protein
LVVVEHQKVRIALVKVVKTPKLDVCGSLEKRI